MRLRRGVNNQFPTELIGAALDRVSNRYYYYFKQMDEEIKGLLALAPKSNISRKNLINLYIAEAYVTGQWGKTFLGNPKKLNQYAEEDHFLALALLGRSCSQGHQRQAIIHYMRALLLSLNEARCADLSNKQLSRFKQEALEYLSKWANKKTPYVDKREQEYALLAKWALSVLSDLGIQKVMKEQPNLSTHQILTLTSNDKFYNLCTLEERVIIRKHLDLGLENAHGHGRVVLSKERERNLLKSHQVEVSYEQKEEKEKSYHHSPKIIHQKLQLKLPSAPSLQLDDKMVKQFVETPLKRFESKEVIKTAVLPKINTSLATVIPATVKLDDEPGARPEDKIIQKKESISLEPGLFKSESDLARQVKLLPEVRTSKNTVKEASGKLIRNLALL